MQSFGWLPLPGGYRGEENAPNTEHHRIRCSRQVEYGLKAGHLSRADKSKEPEKGLAERGLNDAHKHRPSACIPESRNQARCKLKVRESEPQLCNLKKGGGSRS